MKIKVEFTIDKEQLEAIAKENGMEENIDLLSAIEIELGWVAQSGIYVEDIKIIEE